MSQQEWTLQALAEQVGGRVEGDAGKVVRGVASLRTAGEEMVTFYQGGSYRKLLANTAAGAVILAAEDLDDCPVAAIVAEEPRKAFARVAQLLGRQRPQVQPGVDRTASVSDQAEVDPSARIGPYVVVEEGAWIGPEVELGAGSFIGSGARIEAASVISPQVHIGWDCRIGKRAYLHPGVVIGADGFGFNSGDQGWEKIPQLGAVTIDDDVEIGANTTVDRGTLEDTVIGAGVKLDAQVHIGHNSQIGARTIIAGCAGVAGSVVIGEDCVIAGACALTDHIEICAGVTVMGMTGVTNSIKEPGIYASAPPMQALRQWRKSAVRITQLDDMAKRLQSLERQNSE
ncbi:UDP-3-O-(3-hydroxymyristoyl)glucosamine N-acyltransferase [Halorhodospira halochloris]|uniref:UDP-3-O-(3-hydroxymyristoyl)glucosamine N-acyltransferase n=1 Tax=Halorhodospira halochloris TaxID=1052 RepID=UPI001EE96608|nr:UDP-3-O-(3-hydroxymyristoyl)glucosamine N-acyltransferase [Halorhodospira halochloris]MCG5529769.1 UDP-3-O-(3-hydroxymyristoyl)glucosamine N-acyltransferase [Halorhodospira halochloris]